MKLKRTALDALTSLVARMRDKWKCQICFKDFVGYPAPGLDTAHCFSRGNVNSLTRYDLDNVAAVCTWCHIFGPNALHKKGDDYTRRWFRKRIGKKRYEALKWKHDNPSRFPKIDKAEIKIKLMAEKERLENEANINGEIILGAR